MNTLAVDIGKVLARRLFHKRGNHSEVHLTEAELAAMLALAAEQGLSMGKLMEAK